MMRPYERSRQSRLTSVEIQVRDGRTGPYLVGGGVSVGAERLHESVQQDVQDALSCKSDERCAQNYETPYVVQIGAIRE
jgi:hypothetical protein